MTFDLVVVGGGVAGWTAARRAQQLGCNVVVLEKHTAGPGWGNGRVSTGVFHAAYLDPRLHTPAEIEAEVTRKVRGGDTRPELVEVFSQNVLRALQFLGDEGGEFAKVGDAELLHNVLQPITANRDWKGRGPDRMLTSLWQRFLDAGGTFRPGRQAAEIVVEDGEVRGVIATTSGVREEYRGAVLLADGGFGANADLVHHYITPTYLLRASKGSNLGDALQMGIAVGAKCVNMEWFYGHCQSRDALRIDELWSAPSVWPVMAAGITVDGNGARVADEGMGDEVMADRIAKCATPGGCWAIVDDEAWSTASRIDNPIFHAPALDPYLTERGGTVLAAETIEDLAVLAGIPPTALATTVACVNAFVRSGSVVEPPRTSPLREIVAQPFRAVPVIAGLTFTMGGLLVNASAQVLDCDDRPIPNLYAAGGTMGGLQGGPGEMGGYAGGWSEAATFGLLAAEAAASRTPARAH